MIPKARPAGASAPGRLEAEEAGLYSCRFPQLPLSNKLDRLMGDRPDESKANRLFGGPVDA